MSVDAVRTALEARLDAMTPALSTAWQNVEFTPTGGVEYQRVFLLFAEPANPEIGAMYQEQGYLQVTLMYPLAAGPGAAEARAEAIRTWFPRGMALTSGGTTVTIDRTAAIGSGRPDGDRWAVPVKVFFHANVQ